MGTDRCKHPLKPTTWYTIANIIIRSVMQSVVRIYLVAVSLAGPAF